MVEAIDALVALTGVKPADAAKLLQAADGNLEAAAAAFFDRQDEAQGDAAQGQYDIAPAAEAIPSDEVGSSAQHTSTRVWNAAASGTNFQRRILVGADVDAQLRADEHRPHHLVDWKSKAGAGKEWIYLACQLSFIGSLNDMREFLRAFLA